MTTLAEFLLARIAEDEKNALSIRNAEWFHGVDSDVEPEVLAFSNPSRVLAECEAKRRIVEIEQARIAAERIPDELRARFINPDGSPVMYAIALPYADHPDYREEWKP